MAANLASGAPSLSTAAGTDAAMNQRRVKANTFSAVEGLLYIYGQILEALKEKIKGRRLASSENIKPCECLAGSAATNAGSNSCRNSN